MDGLLLVKYWGVLTPVTPTMLTFCQALAQSADQIANKYNVLYLPVFHYIAAVDFVQQFIQTSSAKQVMLNSN